MGEKDWSNVEATAGTPKEPAFTARVPWAKYAGNMEDHGDYYPIQVVHYAADDEDEARVFISQSDENDILTDSTLEMNLEQARQLRDFLNALLEKEKSATESVSGVLERLRHKLPPSAGE